jgi:diadenosine tetraphosphate (Ap4A) HIT family hydrolase
MACELCQQQGGEMIWQSSLCRVVLVDDPYYPGFCRVILNRHEKEMTDLPQAESEHVMQVVFAVERVLRQLLQPEKINLASFGNMTPHVHWHVMPRFADDRHFPQPLWGPVQRDGAVHGLPDLLPQLRQQLALALNTGLTHE